VGIDLIAANNVEWIRRLMVNVMGVMVRVVMVDAEHRAPKLPNSDLDLTDQL
jgi:hypothetical protein